MAAPSPPPPLDSSARANLRYDAAAGFFVFLIALPLCLAVARASGFPPVAGVWTAVIGGVLCSFLSNAELTIKGPAAGLIVVAAGAVTELGSEFGAGLSDADRMRIGYELALGLGATAGVLQILLGLLRVGRLVDYFPLTPVHGLLAAVGLGVVAQQTYEVLGAAPEPGAGPLRLCAGLPAALARANPQIALIGLAGLLILFGLPLLGGRLARRVPAPLVVVLVAVGLGAAFDLAHRHTYTFPDGTADPSHSAEYEVGPWLLVDVPKVLRDPLSAFVLPDFRAVASPVGLRYILLFCLIGSLESLLSAKAVELADPWKRKTDFDRDLLAVGLANTLAASVGALPMVSEIVRSRAGIDGGARTRGANLFHALFLLGFVLLFPNLIHRVPLAALGAVLVYTGFRLAHPAEFVRSYRAGSEQFVVFVGTVLVTLTTDLLVGVCAGAALAVLFHLWRGAPLGALHPHLQAVPEGDRAVVLVVRRAAAFANWPFARGAILLAAEGRDTVTLDLSRATVADRTVLEKLHQLEGDFARAGKVLRLVGLEAHPLPSKQPGDAPASAAEPAATAV